MSEQAALFNGNLAWNGNLITQEPEKPVEAPEIAQKLGELVLCDPVENGWRYA